MHAASRRNVQSSGHDYVLTHHTPRHRLKRRSPRAILDLGPIAGGETQHHAVLKEPAKHVSVYKGRRIAKHFSDLGTR
jgi:hypothetical protein